MSSCVGYYETLQIHTKLEIPAEFPSKREPAIAYILYMYFSYLIDLFFKSILSCNILMTSISSFIIN